MKPISTGKVDFNIPFDNGQSITLSFNPNDIMFFDRLFAAEDVIKNVIDEYHEKTVQEESAREFIAELKENACKKIKKAFDDVFGKDAGNKIFKFVSPFAMVENEYYPFYFINAFTPEISKAMDKSTEELRKKAERMAKHTAKYQKK